MNETIPLSDIRIDKEGVWYFRGAEMFRREIVNFFYANLKIDDQGCYLIQLPGDHGDRCRIEVEDTAFVIRSVDAEHAPDNGVKYLSLLLSDDTPGRPSIRKRFTPVLTMFFTVQSRVDALRPVLRVPAIIRWPSTSNMTKRATPTSSRWKTGDIIYITNNLTYLGR